jgi:hypothetical protein
MGNPNGPLNIDYRIILSVLPQQLQDGVDGDLVLIEQFAEYRELDVPLNSRFFAISGRNMDDNYSARSLIRKCVLSVWDRPRISPFELARIICCGSLDCWAINARIDRSFMLGKSRRSINY